jgi:hypothetical protein
MRFWVACSYQEISFMVRVVPARRLSLSLAIIVLAACGAPPAVVQVDVPTATPPPPTATSAPTATLVPTATTQPTATPAPTVPPTPTPRPDVSLVTGENSFARGSIERRPWMIMIDNHPDAYPQSGLDKATIVFEGLAEYGITRFSAVYLDGVSEDVGEIGPVRSTRVYFVQWAMGFQPVYVHAGGSPDGVQLAETTARVVNFEVLKVGGYAWRDQRRLAPHNLYISSERLRAFAADRGAAELDDQSAGLLYDRFAADPTPDATAIDYFFLDTSSRAGWRYDAASNSYQRTMRGRPHVDRVTGEQLRTQNVVVMEVAEALRPGDDKQRIDQQVVGEGQARIFYAGRALDATWRKPAPEAPLRFYDSNGEEVVFNAGQVWIAAIPTLDRLTVE